MQANKDVNIKTLNLNISASGQNIKYLVDDFWALYVGNKHADFQVSSSTGVGVKWGDIREGQISRCFCPNPYTKIHKNSWLHQF